MIKFVATSPGDGSVGIFSTYWELSDLDFLSLDDQEEARQALQDWFRTYVSDDVHVEARREFTDDVQAVYNILQHAAEDGLQAEVVSSALLAMRDNYLSVQKAMQIGYEEWIN